MTDIRQQLLEARQDVERARQRLQQERSRLSSRATISQTSGRAGVLQRQMATGTIAQQEQVVQQREQELKQVEQQLPGREEYSDADALKIARKLYKAKVGVKNTRGKIRQYYKELRDNEDAAVESAVNDIERRLNISIEPKLKAKIEEDVRKAVTGDIRLAELNDRLNVKLGNQTLDPSQLISSQQLKRSQLEIDALSSKPSTISPFDEKKAREEYYKKVIAREGQIKGRLIYLGERLGGSYEQLAQKRLRQGDASLFYQTQPTQNLIRLGTQTAPYFVPYFGEAALVYNALEIPLDKSVRSEYARKSKELQEEYKLSKGVADIATVGPEIALGGIAGGFASVAIKESLFFRPQLKTEFYQRFPISVAEKNAMGPLGAIDLAQGKTIIGPTGEVISRYPFVTKSLSVSIPRRVVVTSPFRKLFGLKPLSGQKAYRSLVRYGVEPNLAKGLLRKTRGRVQVTKQQGFVIEKEGGATVYGTEIIENIKTPVARLKKEIRILSDWPYKSARVITKKPRVTGFVTTQGGRADLSRFISEVKDIGGKSSKASTTKEYLASLAYGRKEPSFPLSKRGKRISQEESDIVAQQIWQGIIRRKVKRYDGGLLTIAGPEEPLSLFRVTSRTKGKVPRVKSQEGESLIFIVGEEKGLPVKSQVTIDQGYLQNLYRKQAEERIKQALILKRQKATKQGEKITLLAEAIASGAKRVQPTITLENKVASIGKPRLGTTTKKNQIITGAFFLKSQSVDLGKKNPVVSISFQEPTQRVPQKSQSLIISGERIEEAQQSPSRIAQLSQGKVIEGTKEAQRLDITQAQRLDLVQLQANSLRETQRLALRSGQRLTQRLQGQNPKPRKPTGGTPPVYKRLIGLGNSRINIGPSEVVAYKVFIRRKGREILAAKGLPLGLALRAGVRKNLGDLSASFRLEAIGKTKTQDIRFKLPKSFVPSKREKGRIVQIARTRLSARSEVAEIMQSKRRKSVKWF